MNIGLPSFDLPKISMPRISIPNFSRSLGFEHAVKAAGSAINTGWGYVERGWKSMLPKVDIPDYPEIKPTPDLSQKQAAYSFVSAPGWGMRKNPFIRSKARGGGKVSKPLLHGGV